MTRYVANRRTAGVLIATFALGIGTPHAEAKPIDVGPAASAATSAQVAAPASAMRFTASHPPGGISDWGYAAIGSGVASLVLVSAGGTHAVNRRRRRHDTAVQPKVAG